jgi:hypothetical protein
VVVGSDAVQLRISPKHTKDTKKNNCGSNPMKEGSVPETNPAVIGLIRFLLTCLSIEQDGVRM